MLPADWPVLIVDLKDCFFTIPLHPDNRPKFAFTLPTINNAKPAQRYQWRVLPQGMRNSPVLCQWYVARALSGVRKQFPDAHVYHYMDDILVATPTQDELLRLQPQLLNALHSHGLQVAPEKVYRIEPSIDVTVFITTPDLHSTGQITYHLPSHKLLQVVKNTQFTLRPKNSQEPVQGPTVFTDGSGKTGKAIVTWQDGSEWQVLESHEDGSAQLVELKAAVMAFEKFSQEPFNLITDSAYVANIAQRLGCSVLKEVSNPALFNLLKALWCAIQARVHPYYVLHLRSHTNLPGFVAEGVNPRGLKALELWQTDVTQVAEFGRIKYVHVTVDTFSSAMWASAHTGEKARNVIAHWRQDFAVLGIPSAVKTDNGPAYASQQERQFLQSWGVSHNFGIPHSPTGQAIVERAHGTLRLVLQKQKRGMQGENPHSRLAKALYTINHLMVPQNSNNPVILNHHLSLQALDGVQQPQAKVRVQNLVTKQWEGPYDLIAMGRGYACVSTDTGTRWLPSRCVRPDLQPQRQNSADRQGGSRDQLESHQVDESSTVHSDDSSTDSD
ncbi:hypothetical protein DUI87_28896 [Hirundo rustica rustica]|uniref:ribonuclease H n=1 Tax=Hirundo rustica rustica TaxID=333673 RepID=A0A3M0IZL8_HIRRU|nr:hypothetical protein DUI87_28896 [Hirundo rustica rustica]